MIRTFERAPLRGGARARMAVAALLSFSHVAWAAPGPRPQGGAQVVAELALEAPTQETFLLHGTLPVPRGTWFRGAEGSPLTVLQPDGSAARTQVEIVSSSPAAANGADVLEVIARVQRPAGVLPGTPISYRVALEPQDDGEVSLHPAVAALLTTPGALTLSTADVFENGYSADLLQGAPHAVRRDGPLVHEASRHRVLLPDEPKGGAKATMPHLMGVHAHVRTVSEAGYLFLDLHVHNGMDGLDKSDPRDDALEEIYFRHLGLRLPPGWKVLHAIEHPAAGRTVSSGPLQEHMLLGPQEDRALYFMPRQSHFVRRLAVALPGWRKEARAALHASHLGFCRRGATSDGGERWSWWNPETARYFPQRFPLPTLDHVDLEKVRGDLEAEAEARAAQIESGATGGYPLTTPRLGWAHPWGVAYGGMTGVWEIQPYAGLSVAATGSRAGYRLSQIAMRGYMDRQPTALYSSSGRPTRVEDIVVDGANGPYVTTTFYLLPQVGDPFGFDDAPDHQTEEVEREELGPRWEFELKRFAPIDLQHYARYTRNLKILAWLGNDTLAKDELEAAAELYHLSFHPYPYGQYGYVEGSGLLSKIQLVDKDPGQGVPIGRADAWGLDAVAAAYSLGDETFRSRTFPWIEIVVRTFEAGQSTCTGNLQSLHIGKLLGGRFLVSRSNELAYLENAFWGLDQSLFADRDPDLATTIRDILVRSIRARTSPAFWNEEVGGPWSTVGVSPRDSSFDEFCDRIPDSAYDVHVDTFHTWSSLAYGYLLTGDEHFLERAQEMAGSTPLWTKLHADGLDWIGDRAALLHLVQTLGPGR